MAFTCVVGLQWGDEAKGKIVDVLTPKHPFVVRFNGGANAGHTVKFEGKTFKLSILPTGILCPTATAVVGNGVVVYPPRILEELKQLTEGGVDALPRLKISTSAHVILPYHFEQERLSETGKGSGEAIGTTGRGIGPCYEDKAGRRWAIRMVDLLDESALHQKLIPIVDRKNRLFKALDPNAKQFDAAELAREFAGYGNTLRENICDTQALMGECSESKVGVLFEAAQGSLLDLDHGSFPYVTSSNSSAAGIWSGSGFPARKLDTTYGIVKAYTTRVGGGPMPTELLDGPEGIGEKIRQVGREFGTVTGRPRRVGWLDAVALKHTARLNDADVLCLMLLDVLSGHPELKIAVGYEIDGKPYTGFPSDAAILARCQPIYETLPGWSEDITGARKPSDLPQAALKYIQRVSELVGRPVAVASVGPDRAQTIWMNGGEGA
jgi:adenylosuccinate synthase